jgi:hypothetical protein
LSIDAPLEFFVRFLMNICLLHAEETRMREVHVWFAEVLPTFGGVVPETVVDGSTSTIPGVSNFDALGDVKDEEVDNEGDELGSQVSAPSTNSSCKRPSATTNTT